MSSKLSELDAKIEEFQRALIGAPTTRLQKEHLAAVEGNTNDKQVLSTFEREVDKILSDKTKKAMARPLRCGIGWHKWSVWACEEDVGDLYTIRQQRRVCLCCALVDARSIYKDDD